MSRTCWAGEVDLSHGDRVMTLKNCSTELAHRGTIMTLICLMNAERERERKRDDEMYLIETC